MLSHNITLACL